MSVENTNNKKPFQLHISREWLLKMSELEEKCESISVGGLYSTLGLLKKKDNMNAQVKKSRLIYNNGEDKIIICSRDQIHNEWVVKNIGHQIQGDLENLADGEKLNIQLSFEDMTDEEVENLPDSCQ